MKNWLFIVLLFTVSAEAPAAKVTVKDPAYDEYDGLGLVEVLVRDGHAETAREAFSSLSRGDKASSFGKVLEGNLFLLEKNAAEARSKLLSAGDDLPGDKIERKRFLLAQAERALGNFSACQKALVHSTSFGDDVLFLKAECQRRAENFDGAFATLRMKDAFPFVRERVQLYLELGLYSQAEEEALAWVAEKSANTTESLAIAELFEAKGRKDESLRLVELLRVRQPEDPDTLLAWAQVGFRKGLSRDTAEAFSLVSWSIPKYAFHAAEFHRQNRSFLRSGFYNTFIQAEAERLKQRVALAIDQGQYARIIQLEDLIERVRLKDEDVMYALAYAQFLGGKHTKARASLDKITGPGMQNKAGALREKVTGCLAGTVVNCP